MTDTRLHRDLKFVGTAAAALTSALMVVAFIVRQLQLSLYGLPLETDGVSQSYTNFAAALVLAMLLYGVLGCGPLLGTAWLAVRACRRFGWTRPSGGGWSVLFLAGTVLFVLLLPAMEVSSINGLLWHDAAGNGGLTPLVVKGGAGRVIVGGLAVGSVVLVAVQLMHAVAAWRSDVGSDATGRLAAVAGVGVLAFFAFLPVLAATMPGPGLVPRVSVQLRSSVMANVVVDGFLVSQAGNSLFILPAAEAQAVFPVVLPRDGVARIDYRGEEAMVGELLSRRWGNKAMPVVISRMSFALWACMGAALVVVGFVLCPLGPAWAETPEGVGTADRVEASPVKPPATSDLVVHVAGFFPAVGTAVGDMAQMVDMFVGMFTRGDATISAALWLHQQDGSERRLTADDGYSSPRPSRDGSRVAFLRQGRAGILDVASGSVRMLPGDGVYRRLYGWDEDFGLLLALRGNSTLVRIRIEDGTEAATEPSVGADLTKLEALSCMTPYSGVLLVRDNGGIWGVVEKRWGVAENARLLSRHHPIADPAWSPLGIVYVSTGE